jgi:DnaJ-domain-containing protein 1
MAIIPTSQTSARAIRMYQVRGLQGANRSSQSKGPAEQNLRYKSDTVQFSQEALDRLELLKQRQAKDNSKETQAIREEDSNLDKSMKMLQLDSNASAEEIRKAYRNAIQHYHPDKYEHLPPEFRQLAETKSKQINEAYSTLLKLRAG